MMRTPDIGSHTPGPPDGAIGDAKRVRHMVAAGATVGSQMWFHEDMINALAGGRTRDGWSGAAGDDGILVIRLKVLSVSHAWRLTGQRRECPSMPGTWLHEGRWPD